MDQRTAFGVVIIDWIAAVAGIPVITVKFRSEDV
jgi:hypothetical protein